MNDSIKPATNANPKSHRRSLEVTGLGMIASLMIAFWSLVNDGTLPFSEYLVFAALLLVSAAVLVWRIFNLAPAREAVPEESQKPHTYRNY